MDIVSLIEVLEVTDAAYVRACRAMSRAEQRDRRSLGNEDHIQSKRDNAHVERVRVARLFGT